MTGDRSKVPEVSVIIPAYNEGDALVPCIERILDAVTKRCEIIVVYDRETDTTAPVAQRLAAEDPRIVPVLNPHASGPANAIRHGFSVASAPVAVVTMADGSDDPQQIDDLTRLVERGVVVAAASRYMAAGQQVDAPLLKGFLARTAGLLLWLLGRVGTRDPTNSFKAYSVDFVRKVGIDSRAGFEIGLELVAKARRLRLPVAELPTIWLERERGVSNFKIVEWIPHYLTWFLFAFGRRLSLDELRTEARQRREQLDENIGDWRRWLHRWIRRQGVAEQRSRRRRIG